MSHPSRQIIPIFYHKEDTKLFNSFQVEVSLCSCIMVLFDYFEKNEIIIKIHIIYVKVTPVAFGHLLLDTIFLKNNATIFYY
jgi:hypothetical protein